MALTANVWYEALLAVDGDGQTRLMVWEKGDPGPQAARVESHSGWSDLAWNFVSQVKVGVEEVEEYSELQYGSLGRRVGMEDESGWSAWRYDQRGRVVTATRGITGAGVYTTSYTYDPLDRVVSTTYPSGEEVAVTYNPQNLPESLIGEDTYVASTGYNALDQAAALSLGNSVVTTFGYDAFSHRLRSIETGSLLSLNYGYDLVGNVTAMDDGTEGETLRLGYDTLDRLTTFEMAESSVGSVTIRARGGYANGWPAMQLRVNGIVVQEWTVSSSNWVSYTAQATLTGRDQVDVAFTNDYYGAGGDRNLLVDRVRANG